MRGVSASRDRFWIRGFAATLSGALALATPAAGPSETRRLAKIAAAQNVVESRRAGAQNWEKAALDGPLYARDRVRTGAASRAAILYADDTLHRLDEKSEVEIVAPEGDNPGLLKVLAGRHYFASRKPKDFGRVETATVTAAIKGTEFAVDVAEGGTTTITMIEGVVLAQNAFGSVEVGAGERALAEPGKAPVRSLVVRPRDAVAWALYYPPVLGGADAERLHALGEDGTALEKAASLLATGQVEQAKGMLDATLKKRPTEPVALSLASVVALVENRKDDARRLAEEAVRADAQSASAALAASFSAQADFDLAKAGAFAETAARLDPKDPTALARVAELRMATGDLRGAKSAAEAAQERAPQDPRALSVLGFVELARLHTREAAQLFERAVAADSAFATAQLGLGIARIRLRDLEGGRERIQAAVTLDPGNSLLRSYLGKAYYEEKRSGEAGKELQAAKELDPSDPTPWLYSAILLQNENRPVEALDDLTQSIERNGNRAVYRSRLLLDEDQAVRSADLARIFNDLGFEKAGLVRARQSADLDQANHSGHLFLAGNYRALPGFAPAFLSEVLQARIYQPVSANAARPDMLNATASFNEYTALFDRPRVRLFGSAAYGETDTDLSAFDDGTLCFGVPCYTLSEIDDSHLKTAELVESANGDRVAGAFSYSHFDDDGFRVNSDEKNDVFRGFVEVALSDRDTVQLNAIHGDRATGDLPLRPVLPSPAPERFDTTENNFGLGWHRIVSPGSDLALSAIWNSTEQTAKDPANVSHGTAVLEGPQLEVQWVKRMAGLSWIAGAGGFDGTVELRSTGGAKIESDDTFWNGYAYVRFPELGPVAISAGAAVESADVPLGFLPPRDSFLQVADLPFSDTKLSPKLGVTATFRTRTTLRAAGFYRLAPFLGRLQTLEPTQVAGFNQFFEDPGGTRSRSYGAGVDQALGRRLFLGASYLKRDLTVPEAFCDRTAPSYPFAGCSGLPPLGIEERDSDDSLLDAYVSMAPAHWIAGSIGYDREEREFDTTSVILNVGFENRVHTERIRPELRFFTPQGFFVYTRATHYDQDVDYVADFTSPQATRNASFWIYDATLGYRFPKRWGSFLLEALNLGNEKFEFYERSVQERVIPARSLVARLEITY